jgi:chromosome segregation ATPase
MPWTKRGLRKKLTAVEEHEERLKARNAQQRSEIEGLQRMIEEKDAKIRELHDAYTHAQEKTTEAWNEAHRWRRCCSTIGALARRIHAVSEGDDEEEA